MKRINIYQIKDVRECKYAYMSYEYAEDKLNLGDYELVADYEVEDNDDENILNEIWIKGNNGELQSQFKMASVSMSNIIEIDGIKYYVDTFGFKEVE